MYSTVFVAGYENSINGHWQELWYQKTENSYWVEQEDWNNPNCEKWVEALNNVIQSIDGAILLITHSLGGSTVVEWSKKYKADNILGAFLVAIPDVQDKDLPDTISGYHSPPLEKLPFPSLALASTNDPYSDIERTKYYTDKWGCDLIIIGDKGHINNDSNIGEWPEGKALLEKFIASLDIGTHGQGKK